MYVVGKKMARNGRETVIWSVANFGDQVSTSGLAVALSVDCHAHLF